LRVQDGSGGTGGGLCCPVDGVGGEFLQALGDLFAVLVGGVGGVVGGVGEDGGREVVAQFRGLQDVDHRVGGGPPGGGPGPSPGLMVEVVAPQLIDRGGDRGGGVGFGLVAGGGAAGDGGGFAEPVDGGFAALVPVQADHADAGVGVAGEQPAGPQVADVLAQGGVAEPAGWENGGRDPVGAAEPADPVGEFGEGGGVGVGRQVVPAHHHRD